MPPRFERPTLSEPVPERMRRRLVREEEEEEEEEEERPKLSSPEPVLRLRPEGQGRLDEDASRLMARPGDDVLERIGRDWNEAARQQELRRERECSEAERSIVVDAAAALRRAADALARPGIVREGKGVYRTVEKEGMVLGPVGQRLQTLLDRIGGEVLAVNRLIRRRSVQAYMAALLGVAGLSVAGGWDVSQSATRDQERARKLSEASEAREEAYRSRIDDLERLNRSQEVAAEKRRVEVQARQAYERMSMRIDEAVDAWVSSGELGKLIAKGDREAFEVARDRMVETASDGYERDRSFASPLNVMHERLTREAKNMARAQPKEALRLYELLNIDPLDLLEDLSPAARKTLLPQAVHRFLNQSTVGLREMAAFDVVVFHLGEIGWLIPSLSAEDRRAIALVLDTEIVRVQESLSLGSDGDLAADMMEIEDAKKLAELKRARAMLQAYQ